MNKKQRKVEKRKNKRNALVVSHDGKEFWTTQKEFWQWVRNHVVIKTGDYPLTGVFRREHEHYFVVMSSMVLDLASPNHLREALMSRHKKRAA